MVKRTSASSRPPSRGQFAAFAGLRALRHFYFDLFGVDEVVHRHAETPAATCFMEHSRSVPKRSTLLAALARAGLAAEPVHGGGQRLVRLAAERAKRHRARGRTA